MLFSTLNSVSSWASMLRPLALAAATAVATFAAVPTVAATGDVAFSASLAYPEGLTWSTAQKAFLVSSIHEGVVGKVTSDGRYTPFIRDDKLISSIGLQFDAKRNLVWVAIGDPGFSVRSTPQTKGTLAAVAAYDATTGERRAYHDLGHLIEGAHLANDLALDSQGNVYVTDSFSPVIYRVRADARGQGTAEVFVRNEAFTGENFNLNGIVVHPDGFLLVNKHNSGELFRISLKNPSDVQRVKLPEPVKGADGMLLRDAKRLAVVQNSGADRLVELVSNDGWQSATLQPLRKSAQSFPTSAAQVGTDLYVLNSRLDTLLTPDAPKVSDYLLQKF